MTHSTFGALPIVYDMGIPSSKQEVDNSQNKKEIREESSGFHILEFHGESNSDGLQIMQLALWVVVLGAIAMCLRSLFSKCRKLRNRRRSRERWRVHLERGTDHSTDHQINIEELNRTDPKMLPRRLRHKKPSFRPDRPARIEGPATKQTICNCANQQTACSRPRCEHPPTQRAEINTEINTDHLDAPRRQNQNQDDLKVIYKMAKLIVRQGEQRETEWREKEESRPELDEEDGEEDEIQTENDTNGR